MRRKPLALGFAVGVALVCATAAVAGNGGLAPVTPRSPNAERISDVYWLILALCGAVFLVVETALILFVVRFRNRGRGRELEGPQIRGHTRLELAWTAVPVVLLAVAVGYVLYKVPGIKNVPSASAAGDRLEVAVEGRQFYWQFEYPNRVIAVDRLRVPLDRVVRLEITAPDADVIHSWWVPALGGKFDAIPGQTNETWFRATRVGTYKVRCGEFCGVQHARMLGAVEVVPAEEFDGWLAGAARAQAQGTSDLGEQTYEGACAKCHGSELEGLIGPPLAGNPLLRDEEGLEEIVRHGRGAMPAVGEGWSDRQFEALAEYLERRGGGEGGG